MTHQPEATVIDTHAHVYPARYLDHLEELGVPAASTKIARNMRASDEPAEMSARLAQMDEAGVRLQVISATPQSPEFSGVGGVSQAQAVGAARMVNDIYAELIDAYPGRFLAYGAVPIGFPEAAAEMAAELAEHPGFVGVAINAIFQDPDASVAEERYFPLYEQLASTGSVLYIHPTGQAAHAPGMRSWGLDWVNGAPMEDAIAALQLMKQDVPRKFPQMPIHIAHLGGDLPFLAQRLEDNFEDWDSFPTSPAQTLRELWFDSANFTPGALRLAEEIYGGSHLLTGSDYPYFQDEKYTRSVTYIPRAGLGDAFSDSLWRGNALSLYGPKLKAVFGE